MTSIEKGIEKDIVSYLNLRGWAATPNQSGMLKVGTDGNGGRPRYVKLGPEGTEDITCCINGKFVAIEVKKDLESVKAWFRYPLGKRGKKIAFSKRVEAQQRRREEVLKAGGVFILTHSINDLEGDLRHYGLIP